MVGNTIYFRSRLRLRVPSPPHCLRDKFSRRRSATTTTAGKVWLLHPSPLLRALPQSRSSKLSGPLTLRLTLSRDIICRDPRSRRWTTGGEQSRRTHTRGQTDAARFSVQMGDTQFQSGRILRSTPPPTPRRRRCRLGASSFQVTLWPGELSNQRICRVIRTKRGGRVFAYQDPQAPHTSVNPDTYLPGQQVSQRCQSLRRCRSEVTDKYQL